MDNPSFPGYFHVISRFFIWVGGLRLGCLLFVIVDLLYNDHIQSSTFSVTFQGATFFDDRRYPEIGGYVQCFLSYLAQEKHPKLAGKACRALFGQSRMKYARWYLQQLANVVKHGGSTVAKMIQNIIMIMWNFNSMHTILNSDTFFGCWAATIHGHQIIWSDHCLDLMWNPFPPRGSRCGFPWSNQAPANIHVALSSGLAPWMAMDVRGTTHTDHKKVEYTMY